ncbi:hypothetical protein THAOC_23823 [Thalassiosira oceanica]|uniref:Uncharacterized protein n=1 Tax=Thalassiosira oceanica TaxID=159749 RepID=K0S5Z1_THAOC|nr:hypothetical protein THAOC_23823 [Thalassiosira oceanica]|eukprot:EJK56321.1 hypothetical protein THAOC_23823 [Thalassiosira oceanica]
MSFDWTLIVPPRELGDVDSDQARFALSPPWYAMELYREPLAWRSASRDGTSTVRDVREPEAKVEVHDRAGPRAGVLEEARFVAGEVQRRVECAGVVIITPRYPVAEEEGRITELVREGAADLWRRRQKEEGDVVVHHNPSHLRRHASAGRSVGASERTRSSLPGGLAGGRCGAEPGLGGACGLKDPALRERAKTFGSRGRRKPVSGLPSTLCHRLPTAGKHHKLPNLGHELHQWRPGPASRAGARRPVLALLTVAAVAALGLLASSAGVARNATGPVAGLGRTVQAVLGADAPAPEIWIDMINYQEGISGYSVTLVELLTVVKSRPAVSLVEPCMCDSIVFTCAHDHCMKMGGGIPVSEVFDLSWAMAGTPDRPLPLMHSYRDFRRILVGSEAPILNVTSGIAVTDDPGRVQVIQVPFRCWIKLCAKEVAGKLKVDLQFESDRASWGQERVVSDLAVSRLALHPEHYRTVGGVLAASNVTGPFSLVHWRGERQGINFNSCAEKIVRTKERLTALGDLRDSSADNKFILMSSVMDDKANMWWAAQQWRDKFSSETNNPGTALDIIRSGGFLTFDGLLRDSGIKPRDPGLLAVYDLILVGLADQFTTCARASAEGQCHACNYIGKFSKMTLEMRPKDKEDSTYDCWPI